VVPVTVLAVEVQLARTGPRLEDEDGFRPDRLVIRPGEDPVDVTWVGDSTAAGVGADDVEETMAHRVAAGLTGRPVRLTVLARSGAQAHEVVQEQLDDLRRTGADVVLVSVGANDVTHLTRVATFRQRYRAIVEGIRAAAPDADLVLVGIPDIGTAPRLLVPLRQLAGWRGDRLDDEIRDIAADEQVLHVDLAARTGPRFADEADRLFARDRYHPNGTGHGVWAAAVLEAIEVSGLAGSLGS
jgi:lysophospholipase L1-like esterase